MLSLFVATLDESEKATFEKLYMDHWGTLFKYAKSILKSDSLAEDAVQEAFIRILKNLNKIDVSNCSKTKNFMITIVRNVALTNYNHLKNAGECDIDDCENAIVEEHADPTWKMFDVNEAKGTLVRLIKVLPEDQQSLLIYRVIHECSYKELAQMFGISEKNVSVKLTRIRNRLLQLYKNERGEFDV